MSKPLITDVEQIERLFKFDSLPEAHSIDKGYVAEDDPFLPYAARETADPAPLTTVETSFSTDEGWRWHDAALIAQEQPDSPMVGRYAIGAVDLYANAMTGDLGGSYLEIARFDDLDAADEFYHDLRSEIHDKMLLPFELTDFATDKAQLRAHAPGTPKPEWRMCEPAEYAAYEALRSLESEDLSLTRDEPQIAAPSVSALHEIGITTVGGDLDHDPPPFFDAETNTAYWIGIFQPDLDDPSACVTSILSLTRNEQTGEMEAQLAPCVPGDWQKAHGAAEYLLDVLDKSGIDRCLEVAEGMALAADQTRLWEAERGIPLETETAQHIQEYTRDHWEIEL
jgi:hypothetical protein